MTVQAPRHSVRDVYLTTQVLIIILRSTYYLMLDHAMYWFQSSTQPAARNLNSHDSLRKHASLVSHMYRVAPASILCMYTDACI